MGPRRLWIAKRRLFTPTLRVFVGHDRSGSIIAHSLSRNKASIELMKTKKVATTLHKQVLSRYAMHNVVQSVTSVHWAYTLSMSTKSFRFMTATSSVNARSPPSGNTARGTPVTFANPAQRQGLQPFNAQFSPPARRDDTVVSVVSGGVN